MDPRRPKSEINLDQCFSWSPVLLFGLRIKGCAWFVAWYLPAAVGLRFLSSSLCLIASRSLLAGFCRHRSYRLRVWLLCWAKVVCFVFCFFWRPGVVAWRPPAAAGFRGGFARPGAPCGRSDLSGFSRGGFNIQTMPLFGVTLGALCPLCISQLPCCRQALCCQARDPTMAPPLCVRLAAYRGGASRMCCCCCCCCRHRLLLVRVRVKKNILNAMAKFLL